MASGSGFGTWFFGFLVGGVVGVAACAGSALYITKAPIPFMNKVNQASEKINPIADGSIPDPNKPLNNSAGSPSTAPKSKVVTVDTPTAEESATEAKLQQEQGSRFVVQTGAFNTPEAAEKHRADLAMIGFESKIIPRTENGTTTYRVRLGPYGTNREAADVKARLQENSIKAFIGRIK